MSMLACLHEDIIGAGSKDLDWMSQEPNRKLLALIKYTYCVKEREFRLISKIQNECTYLGTELGVDDETIDRIRKTEVSKVDMCTSILQTWKQRGDSEYEVTWGGLLEALNNTELGGVAKQLKRALTFRAGKDNLTQQSCKLTKYVIAKIKGCFNHSVVILSYKLN